jgi:hypothetical protein
MVDRELGRKVWRLASDSGLKVSYVSTPRHDTVTIRPFTSEDEDVMFEFLEKAQAMGLSGYKQYDHKSYHSSRGGGRNLEEVTAIQFDLRR